MLKILSVQNKQIIKYNYKTRINLFINENKKN